MEDCIKCAQEKFGELISGEFERIERMKAGQEPVDFNSLEKIIVGILPGDGIGPIIMKQAVRVANELLKDEIASGRVELREIEGMTIENRVAKQESLPGDVLEAIKKCAVLVKGPMVTPRAGDGLPNLVSANSLLRRELDLFAAVRPVRIPEKGIDWTFFRENIEGEYIWGNKGIQVNEDLAVDFKVQTKQGSERIARAAFEFAKNNGKTNVAIVTKANILKKTDGRFSEICHEVALDYPGINVDDYYIDIMTANLVNPAIRSSFEVFILPNLYGDIITDEAAQLQGGVGTAGSSNTGNRYAMFEAIHGSAPRKMERGEGEYANPSSIIRALEMLLRHIAFTDKADRLSKALDICLESEKKVVMTGHADGATAAEFTDYLIDTIKGI